MIKLKTVYKVEAKSYNFRSVCAVSVDYLDEEPTENQILEFLEKHYSKMSMRFRTYVEVNKVYIGV